MIQVRLSMVRPLKKCQIKQKDATRKGDNIKVSNGVFSHGFFSVFRAEMSSFRVADFSSIA